MARVWFRALAVLSARICRIQEKACRRSAKALDGRCCRKGESFSTSSKRPASGNRPARISSAMKGSTARKSVGATIKRSGTPCDARPIDMQRLAMRRPKRRRASISARDNRVRRSANCIMNTDMRERGRAKRHERIARNAPINCFRCFQTLKR